MLLVNNLVMQLILLYKAVNFDKSRISLRNLQKLLNTCAKRDWWSIDADAKSKLEGKGDGDGANPLSSLTTSTHAIVPLIHTTGI